VVQVVQVAPELRQALPVVAVRAVARLLLALVSALV
jgi:hypothetical protein